MDNDIQELFGGELLGNIGHRKPSCNDLLIESLPSEDVQKKQFHPQYPQEQIDLDFLTLSPMNMPLPISNQWTLNEDHLDQKPQGHFQFKLQEEQQMRPQKIKKASKSEILQKQLQSTDILLRNQTKNITKNFGRAIITYIQKHKQEINPFLKQNGIAFEDLQLQLTKIRKNLNTIADLRQLWVDFKYAKCMRILSSVFLKKHCLCYIFNSRICNYTSHIKYRKRLQKALEEPRLFKSMK